MAARTLAQGGGGWRGNKVRLYGRQGTASSAAKRNSRVARTVSCLEVEQRGFHEAVRMVVNEALAKPLAV